MMEGSSARIPFEISSGLATACLTTPIDTAGLPLKRTDTRSSSGPRSTRATSRTRTGKPVACLTMMAPN